MCRSEKQRRLPLPLGEVASAQTKTERVALFFLFQVVIKSYPQFKPTVPCQYLLRGDFMCTAVSFGKGTHFFGRNLDLEGSYGERVIITPRRYPLTFRCGRATDNHYAFIGMGIIEGGFPLYYEATNERGLSVAALSFPEAKYFGMKQGVNNVASFEVIPWLLSQCDSVGECIPLLSSAIVTDTRFSEKYPPSPLHWLVSDKDRSVVLECDSEGVHLYENKADILTNSPSFPFHLVNLNNYMHLSENPPVNSLTDTLMLKPYSKGMGAIGLPGDMSSASRFVRGFFVKEKLTAEEEYGNEVMQFFHILESVSMPKGTVKTTEGEEYTVYSCCCDTHNGIYYYRTYYDSTVRAVAMYHENLDGCLLYSYPAEDVPTLRQIN